MISFSKCQGGLANTCIFSKHDKADYFAKESALARKCTLLNMVMAIVV